MSRNFDFATPRLPSRIVDALEPLLLAARYANQLDSDLWEFAVEIDQLTLLGLTRNDFRWLVLSGLATHGKEATLEGENGRRFRPAGDLTYCQRSCFVLTESGIQVAERIHESTGIFSEMVPNLNVGLRSRNGHVKVEDDQLTCIPIWDSDRRELRYDGVVVKHFKWVAVNQQAVLGAFEEDGWPPRIDDPLPPHAEQDSKRRLADTIKCLNRKQCNAVLHFRGDGTGEGVVWELVERPEADR